MNSAKCEVNEQWSKCWRDGCQKTKSCQAQSQPVAYVDADGLGLYHGPAKGLTPLYAPKCDENSD